MFIVGLTGGIGSGKTAASDHFKSLGITVVDADVVAREVVEPGTPALGKIVERFGDDILTADKTLDRAKLRSIVFKNDEEKKWLESLLHPLIGESMINQLYNANSEYAILVSPLLVEAGQDALANRVLLIDVPEDIQLKRTMARDSNSEEQVKNIMASQASREQRLAKADDVIVNDSDLQHIFTEVEKLHQKYLEMASAEKY